MDQHGLMKRGRLLFWTSLVLNVVLLIALVGTQIKHPPKVHGFSGFYQLEDASPFDDVEFPYLSFSEEDNKPTLIRIRGDLTYEVLPAELLRKNLWKITINGKDSYAFVEDDGVTVVQDGVGQYFERVHDTPWTTQLESIAP
uniref:hypothetical protein n=1 Tax=Ndongobacter massiliensis TaxID=1871025 RepID=UPI000930D812|nr:hypothetical protein [Ndongobacter massiliensis]